MHLKISLFLVLFLTIWITFCELEIQPDEDMQEAAIKRFQEYLRIKSVHPTPDYKSVVDFLKAQAKRIGLEFNVFEFKQGKPIVLMRWKGTDPSKKSLLLNSHTDVVPAEPEKWKFDPFSATRTPDGNIYARGSQDMKCVGMQYLEALETLNKTGFVPKRNIYLTFVPDEEIGGEDGMQAFVNSDRFKDLNVGFALDEGLASPDDTFSVFYGERVAWWFYIKATGNVGHGSSFTENTATEKLSKVIQKIFEFRDSQIREMKLRNKKSGEVITINLTSFKAGHTSDCGKTFSMNVIPGTAQAGFDMRIPPTVPLENVKKLLEEWAKEGGCEIEFVQYNPTHASTDISDQNPWWRTFKKKFEEMKLKMDTTIFPAATDARFLRRIGIPVIGFSPMINTPILLHDHNEYLNDKVFLNGVGVYVKLISGLANEVDA